MHREIQIKQFPIVTTHWWLRHETSGLCEKTNSIYIVFYLLYTTMSKWSECTHIRVCDVCGARALARRRQRLTEGVSEAWCWRTVIVTTTNHILLWCCMNGIGYLHEAIWLADASVGAWKSCISTTLQDTPSSVDADAPCECSVSQSARTHTSCV